MRAYEDRLRQVIDYINHNLDGDLSLRRLSQVANVSRFHLHRQFQRHTGMRLAKFVRLLRLKRASLRLAFQEGQPIIDIALEAGFANPESFSRAFKQFQSQSPSKFRQQPWWPSWREQFRFQGKSVDHPGAKKMQVEIVDFPRTKVAALEHHGAPEREYETVKKFIQWRIANGISPEKSKTYGIHYNNPATTPPQQYRFDICSSISEDVKPNPQGVVSKEIPALRCAKTRHLGQRENLYTARWLCEQWLPQSGEKLGDFPLFFHYLNVGPDVEEHAMITDIYLPLRER